MNKLILFFILLSGAAYAATGYNSDILYIPPPPASPTSFDIIGGAKVGIGTTAPISSLDVSGGLTLGASYVGINAAPTNGLIVQGNVGIGTTAATGQFHLGNAAAHAGQAACWTTNGQIGFCTTVVGAGGACTCTGL